MPGSYEHISSHPCSLLEAALVYGGGPGGLRNCPFPPLILQQCPSPDTSVLLLSALQV